MKCTHLHIVKESYVQHLRFSVYLCSVLVILSAAALIHGLCPWILTAKVSNRVRELNTILNERWKNPKE